jgi:hypothetical protein
MTGRTEVKGWETSRKEMIFGTLGALDRKILTLFSSLWN